MTVLAIIEDDDKIRRSLETALTGRGFTVIAAPSGLEGLRNIVEHHPDAVVLDLGLPDIDGLELVKMIRAVSEVPRPATTSRGSSEPSMREPTTMSSSPTPPITWKPACGPSSAAPIPGMIRCSWSARSASIPRHEWPVSTASTSS
jgi:CheY-like chemotaxis protein